MGKLRDKKDWYDSSGPSNVMFSFVVKQCTANQVNAIGLKLWRDDMANMIGKGVRPSSNDSKDSWFDRVKAKLSQYEAKYRMLKEATTYLELALWKNKLCESNPINHQNGRGRRCKKLKLNESGLRRQYRVNCGADVVIGNVLPYLLPVSESSS